MSELKKCKITGRDFEVRDQDLEFYRQIGVPGPSMCPEERDRRRMVWRNESCFYKRKSDLSGEEMISIYAEDSPFVIYARDEWWNGDWQGTDFGRDYDFGMSFFQQFHRLQLEVPRLPLVNNKAENSDYCNFADGNKNCYLLMAANENEDCFHSTYLLGDKDCSDCLWVTHCELCYECIDCSDCYNLKFAQNCVNCSDGEFLEDCRNVRDSFLCVNLRSKRFCVLNKQYSEEEYGELRQKMLNDPARYQKMAAKFEELKCRFPQREAAHIVASEQVLGNNIFNSKNVYLGFDIYNSEDCAYIHDGLNAKNCVDVFSFDQVELSYESVSLIGYHFRFTMYCRESSDLTYCDSCYGCQDLFGCVGLRNKRFCILNKQYSEEEYRDLVPRIVDQMRSTGEWGEFFPMSMSPFAYNETAANLIYPLHKEKVLQLGAKWKDDVGMTIVGEGEVVKENCFEYDRELAHFTWVCAESGKRFRMTPHELRLYQRLEVPLPRLAPDVRHRKRLAARLPNYLYQRECRKCGVAVQSPYKAGTGEQIYCSDCFSLIVG